MSQKCINLIGLSGGKDSTVLLGWAIYESGYSKESIVAYFCDTENEYEEVYDQIRNLNDICVKNGIVPIKYLRVSGDWVNKYWFYPLFLALAVWKRRFPSAKARFCTEFLKIKPSEAFIKELIAQGYEIVLHFGVRANESIERSLLAEWGIDGYGRKIRRPLLSWSISDVWEAHKRFGLPINPLYKNGWKRVGCRLCILSRKDDVRRTVRKRPWIIDMYSIWELIVESFRKFDGNNIGVSFFHRKTAPLVYRSKVTNTKQGLMMISTVKDIAKWSLTMWGGRKQIPQFMLEEEDFNIDDAYAPCKSGYCE